MRRRIEQQAAARETARAFAARIAEEFPPMTAILFGSFARGDLNDGSDIDLLLISDAFPENYMARQRIVYEASPGGIDIFTYRWSEFREMLRRNHPTAYWAAREGVVLFGPPPVAYPVR